MLNSILIDNVLHLIKTNDINSLEKFVSSIKNPLENYEVSYLGENISYIYKNFINNKDFLLNVINIIHNIISDNDKNWKTFDYGFINNLIISGNSDKLYFFQDILNISHMYRYHIYYTIIKYTSPKDVITTLNICQIKKSFTELFCDSLRNSNYELANFFIELLKNNNQFDKFSIKEKIQKYIYADIVINKLDRLQYLISVGLKIHDLRPLKLLFSAVESGKIEPVVFLINNGLTKEHFVSQKTHLLNTTLKSGNLDILRIITFYYDSIEMDIVKKYTPILPMDVLEYIINFNDPDNQKKIKLETNKTILKNRAYIYILILFVNDMLLEYNGYNSKIKSFFYISQKLPLDILQYLSNIIIYSTYCFVTSDEIEISLSQIISLYL